MENNKIKMQDVAKELGISTVTVSKALNDKDGVSAELREKIKKTALDMGYKINRLARSMKTGQTYNIGIVLPGYYFTKSSNFYLYYLCCLLDELNKCNYYGVVQVMKAKQIKHGIVPKFCEENTVDGVVFLGQMKQEYIAQVVKTGMPIVLSDFYDSVDNVEAVAANNFNNSYQITNYLFGKGHRKIGFVGSINATSSIQDRYLGYAKAMLEHGISVEDEWVLPDRGEDNSVFDTFAIPDKTANEVSEKMPTAFVCNCDENAYVFIKNLKSKGYRVPEDCSIVTFDNTVFSEICQPSVTTVEVDVVEMARLSVEKILLRIESNSKNKTPFASTNTFINGTIVEKESVYSIYAN